jgi:signal transduction histidine kinase
VPRATSIVVRIFLLQLIVVGAAAILVLGSLYLLLVVETNKIHHAAMREHADQIAQHLILGGDGRWRLDLPEILQDLYSQAYGRYVYAVRDDNGEVLFSTMGGRSIFSGAQSETAELLQARYGDAAYSGARLLKEEGARRAWIEVAENVTHRDALLDDVVSNFFPRVAWIVIPILLLLLAIDVEIVRRAFRPVLAASRLAKEISPTRADLRLASRGIPSEIAPLVVAINGALDRLEHGFRVQRDFTADAAHELRTPLTILRTRIETLGDARVANALLPDIEAMTRIVTQLLEMAEVENMELDIAERAELRSVAIEVISFLAPLALAQGKNIGLAGGEDAVWVAGHGQMIARALRNVIENAIKHTPVGGGVEVEITDAGRAHIRDSGPGIGPSEHKLLFRRFWRRERDSSSGAGLGLSIVQRIMEIHGGTVTIANLPTGGAQFSLIFRLAPDLPDHSPSDSPSRLGAEEVRKIDAL